MSLSKYRPDIDGLRAIAVISVMLFHAGLSNFGGGFIGVDIFFVISGYLITSILINEIENGKFSLATFYERRIRRIIPALLFMILVSSAVFFFILLPDDLENFGQSIVATLLFSNNILLWMTSGYFESSIELKPLAHTWSLGVEEQFYIITPVLLIICYKFWNHKGIIFSLVAAFILSFVFCIFASSVWGDANFYLIFSRIWEIGAGSIAATAGARSMQNKIGDYWAAILSNIALVVILISPYAYKYNYSNPNIFTAFVILATYLIISFNKPQFWAAKILSNRLFLFIGALSYSLYLWHQPIYVLIRVVSLEEPGLVQFAFGAFATFILGYLSWRFVELPFRNKQQVTTKMLYLATGSVTALLFAIGLTMHFTSGFYSRWPELSQNDRDFGKGMNIAFNEAPYRYLNRSFDPANPEQKILVIGNSYARDFINMLDKTERLAGKQLVYSDRKLCEVVPGERDLMAAAGAADVIVVAVKLDQEVAPCFLQMRKLLGAQGDAKFIVLGTKNFGWNNNAIMMLEPERRYSYQAKVVKEYVASNEIGRKLASPDEYVDILTFISPRYGYVPVFTPDRKFISQDREHLTPAGARYIGELIFKSPVLSVIGKSGETDFKQ